MSEIVSNIQPYAASRDLTAVFALWQATVGAQWPIGIQRFQQVLAASETQHFVAKEGEEVVGFVATGCSERQGKRTGHLLALLVAPARQGRGIGSALHTAALQCLRESDVGSVQCGGLVPRFWCGVPDNLPQAQAFFRSQGWGLADTVYDMVQDLHHYTTPPAVYQRMLAEQISIEAAGVRDAEDVLAFERREFPGWLMHYQRCANHADYQDIVVARDLRSGKVIGTTVLYSALWSHPDRADMIWQSLLGADVGTLGAVGVAPSERGRGIGIGLVARASDLLKQRGAGNCYIDWLVLTDFYSKLGYSIWRSYHVGHQV